MTKLVRCWDDEHNWVAANPNQPELKEGLGDVNHETRVECCAKCGCISHVQWKTDTMAPIRKVFEPVKELRAKSNGENFDEFKMKYPVG